VKADNQVVIYEGGEARVEVRVERESVWLSLQQLAELFGRDKSVISRHLKAIFASGELERAATVAKNAQFNGRANARWCGRSSTTTSMPSSRWATG